MKKILLLIALLLTITTATAQDSSTVRSSYTTMTKVFFVTPFGGVPQEEQVTVEDTTVSVIIDFRNSFISIDKAYYIISEYAWDDVHSCFIILVSDKNGRYMYMIYYSKRDLFGIKYNDGQPDVWYY
jgi:hypothetical protein